MEEVEHVAAKPHRHMTSSWKRSMALRKKLPREQTNVSGGQKQRLSIARALVRKPDVYVFDDSFSALDFKTDAIFTKRIKERNRRCHRNGGSTARISSIMDASDCRL